MEALTAEPGPAVDVLLAVSAAARAHEVLRFYYGTAGEDQPARQAGPHHVTTWNRRWYLTA